MRHIPAVLRGAAGYARAAESRPAPRPCNPPSPPLQEMGVAGLTRENVASHLQKHRMRLKREEEEEGGGDAPSGHPPAPGSARAAPRVRAASGGPPLKFCRPLHVSRPSSVWIKGLSRAKLRAAVCKARSRRAHGAGWRIGRAGASTAGRSVTCAGGAGMS